MFFQQPKAAVGDKEVKERAITVSQEDTFCLGQFTAMASPCEILIDSKDTTLCAALTHIAADETYRIMDKFSRYNPQSLCSQINNSNGVPVAIDPETHQLLEFANQCYLISEGLFDITSGVLRKIWTFDGGGNLPSAQAIKAVLPHIGWQKVRYDKNSITLPAGMEIDFGGIGKEYAVDTVGGLLKKAEPNISIVVNFGGDLAVTTAKPNNGTWTIGIENPGKADSNERSNEGRTKAAITIKQGALATSGDARRFLLKDGKRYSHILNPKTGWPIVNAPRSVTVAAPQCIQAGILSTVALLQGDDAEAFLAAQDVSFWCFK